MDLVLPYFINGQDQQLRYALRSWEKHLSNTENLFIIGEAPKWLRDVIVIPSKDRDRMGGKERNIFSKIALACDDMRVSDAFLFVNDDHYLLQDYDAEAFPEYFHSIIRWDADHCTNPYKQTLQNTLEIVSPWARNFDGHCPIVFSKELFMRSVGTLDWSKPYGYCIKSIYCALNGIEGEYCNDQKFRKSVSKDYIDVYLSEAKYFSTDDRAMNRAMVQALNKLYPQPSRWETLKEVKA